MSIRILSVLHDSPAFRAGILPGESVLEINHEPVLDEIDYQALSSASRIQIVLSDPSGHSRTVCLHKKSWESLGLCLDEREALKPRACHNHCVFCFIDQMPPGMRRSLYVKDDDWRLSVMMGNYVTLTNVDDNEFARILKRKASPLYISVHATDPDVRIRMLRNPRAGRLMEQLKALKEHGMKFHCQIVLCPGINDGAVLDKTLHDLAGLMPAVQSLAVVPLGMTKYRQRLEQLDGFTPETAAAFLDQITPYQNWFLKTYGTRFVFPSDEFYCLSGRPLPSDEAYENYGQIEDGVGMLRLLEQQCKEAFSPADLPQNPKPRHLVFLSGTSAAPFIQALADRYAPDCVKVEVIPVSNHFFGETITVTGLLVGQDLIRASKGIQADEICLSSSMLREQTDRFLDDMRVREVEEKIGIPIRIVENRGDAFIRALWE
ncbi:MAG: DUF512 domain-containing protein [Oscillospiraceae bacterium]|nr:DUF512 domain-containing protein [Oscillospiraceae bacterium]